MTDPDAPHPWGWTATRRAKQAQAIRRRKPWLQKSGAVTQEGTARVAKNACKPESVRRQVAAMMAELKTVIRQLTAIEAARRRRCW
jgi:hypothetical protein